MFTSRGITKESISATMVIKKVISAKIINQFKFINFICKPFIK